MSNHIALKFFSFYYSSIPQATFVEKMPILEEHLRKKYFPRWEARDVKEVFINASDDVFNAQQKKLGTELHMVDAEGKWGIKLGNQAILFSISDYVAYEESIGFIKPIIEFVVDALEITHFSNVVLRNINLFKSLEDDKSFVDIKKPEYWGRQSFGTLDNGFSCNGASTRHVYMSEDYLTQVTLTSGVVMKGQSHIPQDEWDIWKMRGGVPVLDESAAKLIIDIACVGFQSPINVPKKQLNVTEYSWDLLKSSFDRLHTIVNGVYEDIAKE